MRSNLLSLLGCFALSVPSQVGIAKMRDHVASYIYMDVTRSACFMAKPYGQIEATT